MKVTPETERGIQRLFYTKEELKEYCIAIVTYASQSKTVPYPELGNNSWYWMFNTCRRNLIKIISVSSKSIQCTYCGTKFIFKLKGESE